MYKSLILDASNVKKEKAQHSLGTSFGVEVKQTKLFVAADRNLFQETRQAVLKYRKEIEDYIKINPDFLNSFSPLEVSDNAPSIVKDMAMAAYKADVGPMAAVAGAIAEKVGMDLLNYSPEVIVENGGDIFLSIRRPVKVAIFAGRSPLNLKIALQIEPDQSPLGICTSAGTVGPSISFGKADAVCIVSRSAAVADAFATAIGNIIKSPEDINMGIEMAKRNSNEIIGLVIIVGDQIGLWGGIKVVPI